MKLNNSNGIYGYENEGNGELKAKTPLLCQLHLSTIMFNPAKLDFD